MIGKIKNIGYGALGIGLFALFVVAFALLIFGGAKLFEILYPILEGISSITWGVVWLLLLLSVVPRFRNFTGSGIVLGTYIGGAIFWLLCFYVTYQLWGFLGIFVGILFFGLGVFITATLALIFDGQLMGALGFAFILAQIFLLRFLGYWIISKYRGASSIQSISDKAELVNGKAMVALSYCSECGHQLDYDGKFCPRCGAEVKEGRKFIHLGISSDDELWDNLLSSTTEPDVKEILRFIKKHFFDKDDVKPVRYFANHAILMRGNRELASQYAEAGGELDLSRYGTKSIDWLAELGNRPVGYDDWFMAAYPDVVKWASHMADSQQESFNELLGNPTEEHFFDKNGKVDMKYLRQLVDIYKRNHTLEASLPIDTTTADVRDPLLPQAIEITRAEGKVSSALLQRRLHIGYPQAALLLDLMEEAGVIGPADGNKPRHLLN